MLLHVLFTVLVILFGHINVISGRHTIDEIEGRIDDLFAAINAKEKKQERQSAKALISGMEYFVTNSGLTASSSYNNNHGPYCSRLQFPKPSYCHSNAWARNLNASPRHWIQVDFKQGDFVVLAVATQGRGDSNQWVTSYKLAIRRGEDDTFYTENGIAKVFEGNTDRWTVVRHELDPPLEGQVVRLYPLTFSGYMCLRWELYGWPSSLYHS